MLSKTARRLREENSSVVVAHIDLRKYKDIGIRYQIMGIPTLKLYKHHGAVKEQLYLGAWRWCALSEARCGFCCVVSLGPYLLCVNPHNFQRFACTNAARVCSVECLSVDLFFSFSHRMCCALFIVSWLMGL